MNTISNSSSYIYRGTQQADKQNHVRNRNGKPGSMAEQFYQDVQIVNTKDSGISMQEAYERLRGSGKCSPSLGGLDDETKVTEIAVWSLKDFSFYLNEDTGEISCISHYDNRPGWHPLWSKTILPEDRERVYNQLFDRYKDVAAGDFVYRYRAYLPHEEFWDMYLEGKVNLASLIEHDDTLSDGELYNKFRSKFR